MTKVTKLGSFIKNSEWAEAEALVTIMIGGGGDDLFEAGDFDNISESDDGLEDIVDNEAGEADEAASGRC